MAKVIKTKKKVKKISFVYKGKKDGAVLEGEIDAIHINAAKKILKEQQIQVKEIKKAPFRLGGFKISPLEIALFTRQMATMMKSGVPLLQSFDIIIDGQENPALKKLIIALKMDVASGNTFAESLRKYPDNFDELYCNLVDSGEQSGALEALLDRIASYKEKTELLKQKIKKAMNYPIGVLVVAGIVSAILLIKVVPQFESVFQSFGAELPAFTQMIIRLSNFLQEYWWSVLGTMYIVFKLIGFTLKKSKKARNFRDKYILKMPIVGDLLYKTAIARFARTLATTFAAGVPLVEALESVSGAAGNNVFVVALDKIQKDVSTGIQLNVCMKESGIFPPLAIQMTSIGEESGALDAMLEKVATHYEIEVDDAVDGLTSLMEPLIMAVLGVLVGGLVIAMYLPIFAMGSIT